MNLYSVYGLHKHTDLSLPSLKNIRKSSPPDIQFVNDKSLEINKDDYYFLDSKKGIFVKNNLCNIEILDGECIKYNLSNKMSPVQKAITLLNQPIAYALFQKKEFVFHASAIEIQDKAYIFIGPSNSGKSFFSMNLLNFGNLITEDICRIKQDKNAYYLYQAHPYMKLTEDPMVKCKQFIVSKNELYNDIRGRSCFTLKDRKISNKLMPIEACFFLNYSNEFKIQLLDSRKALGIMLWSSFLSNPYQTSTQENITIHKKIEDFILNVPIFNLSRPKSFLDFNLLYDEIINLKNR